MRFEKVKTWNALQAIARHNNRTIPTENSDINPELSHLNKRGGNVFSPGAIRSHYTAVVEKLTRKPRPDAVKAIHCVATFSKEAVNRLNQKEQESYFEDCLKAFDEKFGKANRIGYWIHYDETTPHLHCAYIPVDPHGVLNCKHYLGGDISEFQTEFHEAAGRKYGLDRGIKRKDARKHQTLKAYRDKLLRKDLEMNDIEDARAGLLAMAEVNLMHSERLAHESKDLERQKIEVAKNTKKNAEELVNLQKIREFLENNQRLKLAAIAKSNEKYESELKSKIEEIDRAVRLYKEFKTMLELNAVDLTNKKIQKPDYISEMEKAGKKPTGYIKTALEGPLKGPYGPDLDHGSP
jgi:hypothetical protein